MDGGLKENTMKARSALLFSLVALTLGTSASAFANPPPWAPAHGYRAKEVREYRYVYYPAQQVYYEPEQRVWFWMNGGAWQFGVNLPVQYRAYVTSGVPVVLHSPRPYVEHVYVEQHYGRPWRERHHHEIEHRERHERHDGHDRDWHDDRRDDRHGHDRHRD
jgi:hypothetical protein